MLTQLVQQTQPLVAIDWTAKLLSVALCNSFVGCRAVKSAVQADSERF